MNKTLEFNIKQISLCVFLVPALLLCTPNFSVAVIIFCVLSSLYCLIKNRQGYLKLNSFDWLCLFILSTYLISNIPVAIVDWGNFRYFKGGARLLLCIPIYLMLINILNMDRINCIFKHLTFGVIFGSIATLGVALYQYIILNEVRVGGFLYSINFGYLSCSLAFLALCLMKSEQSKSWLFFSFISASIATILTLTRGAIFAIPLLLMLICVVRYKQLSMKKVVSLLSLLAIVGLGLYYSSTDIQRRVAENAKEFAHLESGQIAKAPSAGGRIELWKTAYQAFVRSPIIGMTFSQRVNLNQELYREHETTHWVTTVERAHAHSQYFEMLASTGILGVISFVTILFLPIFMFFHHYKKTNSLVGYVGGIFVAGFAIFGLTEVLLTANLIGAFYGFFLAIFLAIMRVEKYGQNEEKIEGTLVQ
ncbi:O-antigen ligase family protein [Vibrio marisflavi]|uniref:O-antigen ligase-related domain-containing protein n=1 Tax=Vibrio marisflavi CECT 7928 TaxID=634439 RepID=A0ABM9A840_9VIBR|nr:O-antigen ligase family protein [Vibrio marisflavi]CAH0541783.1 hypothetical protein VMF7928_03829 [Vibrio marisflavi CECT 7928]